MPPPLGNCVCALKDENVQNSSLFRQKQNKFFGKTPHRCGTVWCEGSCTQKSYCALLNTPRTGLLDTPEPKDEAPTVQIQCLKPLRAKVQLVSDQNDTV